MLHALSDILPNTEALFHIAGPGSHILAVGVGDLTHQLYRSYRQRPTA